ncbi:FadR/GntR family transcriptional regulator [Rubrobacter xylanophilus]|uniref:FadR/GntR family transcriptional regulator n=1 Tax=Rubrobacter xylanophilus TaxID=49319 RepID=UPI00117A04F1
MVGDGHSLAEEAIRRLKAMILSGELAPGERLPVERELAARLGISRGSLREAVRALALVGVLRTRRGDGTYVTSLEPGLLLEATGMVAELLQENSAVWLLEVRRMLEPGATALAAARMSPEEISGLRECLERLEKAPGVEELVAADDEFHARIASAAGNPVLSSLLRGLAGRTLRARLWRGVSDQKTLERTRLGHRAIFQAIERRDPELARAAAASHIAEVEDWFRSNPQEPA